jgi:hypothetical protein
VSIGAPHLGLPAERALDRVSRGLQRLPETRAASRTLARRSAGLRDGGTGRPQHPGPRVACLFVSGTVAADSLSPAADALGDLVVSRSSAWAKRRGQRVRGHEAYREVAGVSHYALPRHEGVHRVIIDWLARAALVAGAQP